MGNAESKFEEFLEALLEEEPLENITPKKDSLWILSGLVLQVRNLNAARKGFIREEVSLDEKGRMVIPKNFRDRLLWNEDTPLEALVDTDPKGVFIRKAY